MGTNAHRLLIDKSFTDKVSTTRKFRVWERDNTTNYKWPEGDFTISDFSTRYYQNHKYSHLLFAIDYKTKRFKYADVIITNRFTMDSETISVDFTKCTGTGDSKGTYHNVKTYSCVQGNYSANSSGSGGTNWIHVILSMFDFYFGDVYVIFYEDANNKEYYMAPVTVQFANAPTVYSSNVFKWHPQASNSTIETKDYDNVFSVGYGAYSASIADSGRVNVLSGNASNSEYYNNVLTTKRLITNGLADTTLSGHPAYIVEYRCMTPNELSKEYGTSETSMGFAISAAYLAKTDDLSTTGANHLPVRVTLVQDIPKDTDTYTMVNADNSYVKASVLPAYHYQKYYAFITKDLCPNVTDADLRDHRVFSVDFMLSGVHADWMSMDK